VDEGMVEVSPEAEAMGILGYLSHRVALWRGGSPVERIAVFLSGRNLATFVRENVVAAAITRHFPGADALAIYDAAPFFRQFVVACNLYLSSEMQAAAGARITFPIDWFDIGNRAPVRCPDPIWRKRKRQEPHLVLLPTLLRTDPIRLAGLAENPPIFRLPASQAAGLENSLQTSGLDPGRWFACLCIGKTTEPWTNAAKYLFERGAQVVVVGPPGAPLAGVRVTDLRGSDDHLPAQAAALVRARFCLGDEPGRLALASAFRTPVVASVEGAAWNRDDLVLHRTASATPIAAIEYMLERTADCTGWRSPATEIAVVPWQTLTFPLPLRDPLVRIWQ
jgi:hypothetical protein